MAGDEGAAADRRIGAHLLNWLAPKSDGPFEEVPVDLTLDTDQNLGIVARKTVLKQARTAMELIQKHNPERIVVMGGDLNERYDGDTALLWVDSHPDVSIPEEYPNHHAMVLANLLGVGDREFVAKVPKDFKPEQVLFVGLNDMFEALGSEPMRKMKLSSLDPNEFQEDSSKVLQWLDERKPFILIWMSWI